MRKHIRITSLVLLLALCVSLILPSCANKDRLEVISEDFPKLRYLEAGEFDESQVDRIYESDFELNNMYYVSERDGKLFIYNGIDDYYDYRHSHLLHLGAGYFVGIDMGEFGGWLRYYEGKPYYNNEEGVLIAENNCLGYQEVDYEKFFSFIGDVAHLGGYGKTNVYLMERSDGDWNWKSIAEVDGEYRSSVYDKENKTLYIVTFVGIFAVDQNGKVYSYGVPKYFKELGQNSAVITNGVLYVGTWCGIYAQPVDGSASTWYPLSPY